MIDFKNDYEGFMKWAEENWTFNPNFCPRHWAPCPVEGKNGLIASVMLSQEAISMMPEDIQDPHKPDAMNAWLMDQKTPTCCKLGDERMAEIWAEC